MSIFFSNIAHPYREHRARPRTGVNASVLTSDECESASRSRESFLDHSRRRIPRERKREKLVNICHEKLTGINGESRKLIANSVYFLVSLKAEWKIKISLFCTVFAERVNRGESNWSSNIENTSKNCSVISHLV